jgi:hypothetical protein
VGGKPVAAATSGENHLRVARVVAQLAAEVGDVHVDGAGDKTPRVQPPDVLEDFVARDRPVSVGGKITEEFDLADGEFIALAAVVADLRVIEVDDPVREVDNVSWSRK